MGYLYNYFEKVAGAQEPQPQATPDIDPEVYERMTILEKYAQVAEGLLAEEYGDGNYTPEDVEKVAEALIIADMEQQEMQEKIAEAYDYGRIMAKGFKDELGQ